MKNLFFLSFLLMSFLSVSQQNADTLSAEKPKYVKIVKQNGKVYYGYLLKDDGREILIDTKELGKLYLQKSEINVFKYLEENEIPIVTSSTKSKLIDTLDFTRYLVTDNALPLRDSSVNTYLYIVGFDLEAQVLKNTSINVFAGWILSPIGVGIKQHFGTWNQKLHFSLGLKGGTMGYIGLFRGFGAAVYGSVTYGNFNNNVTLSAGYSVFRSGLELRYDAEYIDTFNVQPDDEFNTFFSNFSETKALYRRPVSQSLLFSLAAKYCLTKKASFILEAIVGVSEVTLPTSEQYMDIDNSNDAVLQNFSSSMNSSSFMDIFYNGGFETTYPTGTTEKSTRISFFASPSIRKRLRANKVFQASLGIYGRIDKNNSKFFPVPMVSWFYSL